MKSRRLSRKGRRTTIVGASAAAVVIVIKVMGEAPAPESALPGDEVTLLDPVAPPTGTQAVAPPVGLDRDERAAGRPQFGQVGGCHLYTSFAPAHTLCVERRRPLSL